MIPSTDTATISGENYLPPLHNPAALAGVVTEFARRRSTQRTRG